MIFTPKTHWYAADVNNPQYTTYNAYYGAPPHELWMPNCVAWAYGRWNQLSNATSSGLWPTTAANLWFSAGVTMGLEYATTFDPQVGACICFESQDPDPDNEHGHVCIIEQIHRPALGQPFDYVYTSNSFYNEDDRTPQDAWPFFVMGKVYRNDPDRIYCDNGLIYYQRFQGLLYHPNFPRGETPSESIDPELASVLFSGRRRKANFNLIK